MSRLRGLLKPVNMKEQENTTRQITKPHEELIGEKISLFNHENKVFSILHIDDDKPTLYISKLFLEELSPNIRIKSESDSTKINNWMNEDFDCYLVDYLMPKNNGLAVCKKIRELKNTPIILFTSLEEDEIPRDALQSMNVRYLQKNSDPANYDRLTEAILELVKKDLNTPKFTEGGD